MKITENNFVQNLNELQNRDGKNRVYYKLISFATFTKNGSIKFTLAPNIIITIILFLVFLIAIEMLVIKFLQITSEYAIVIQLFVSGYTAYLAEKYLTAKIFKRQISEFSSLIQDWKQNLKRDEK